MRKSKVLILCLLVSLITWFATTMSMDYHVFSRNIPVTMSHTEYIDNLEDYVYYCDSTLSVQDSLILTQRDIITYSECRYNLAVEKYDSLMNDMIRLTEKWELLKSYKK